MQNLPVNDKNLAIEGKNLYRYRALKEGEKNEKKEKKIEISLVKGKSVKKRESGRKWKWRLIESSLTR